MVTGVDASTLDRQPRMRRTVYEHLANGEDGLSVKELLQESDVPEAELRETLRKLQASRTSAASAIGDAVARALGKDRPMVTGVDASTLDRQPRMRRTVYEHLANGEDGLSVKELLQESDVPEAELRETLRKLQAAGLVQRSRAVWTAVPITTP